MALGPRWRRRAAGERHAVAAAYAAVVAQARAPGFFAELGVPDTLDGRFESMALHMFLLLHRLKAEPSASGFGQALFDFFFADMDRSLREMGAGDLGVGRRVKAMAEALYGRIAAYEAGLAADASTLADALRRNLYGTVADPDPAHVSALARYLARQRHHLASLPLAGVLEGDVAFLPLAAAIGEGRP